MRIHYGGAYPQRIEAALSSLPALLFLKEINKRRLPFLNSGSQSCIYDKPESPHLGNWSTKIRFTSQECWNVPRVTDLVEPLIFKSGVKSNATPTPLGLNCIYSGSNTKAKSSLHLPAEAMIRRKTVSRSKALEVQA